jgi:Uma2 family endonuclease
MAVSTLIQAPPNVSTLVQAPELHRMSIEEYHRLIECGGFDEEARVELIDGYIVDMSPKSPPHENAIRWLMYWLFDRLDRSQHELTVGTPLTIAASEPEPDLVVVEHSEPKLEHATRAPLVIEVSVSSRERDLRAKPTLYAQAIDEYWVVDLERRCVVVHREPSDGAYREVESVAAGSELRARSVDLGPLDTGALFAAAFAEGRRAN